MACGGRRTSSVEGARAVLPRENAARSRGRLSPRARERLDVVASPDGNSPAQMIRVLVAVYYFPPAPVNSYRWVAMARHLRAFGVEVTILTTRSFGRSSVDQEMQVIRTGDAAASPTLRRLLGRESISESALVAPPDQAPPGLLTRLIVPDPLIVSWNPWALFAARGLLRSNAFDCFVTSTPANSTALLGPLAGRRTAWLCDLRDPWRFEDLRQPFPTAPQRYIDDRLENYVLNRAEVVTTVQSSVAEYVESRTGRPAVHVPNGWDPRQATGSLPPGAAVEPGTFRVVHTGSLSGPWGRSPRAFFVAFADAFHRMPQLRLLLAGGLGQEDLELVGQLLPPKAVRMFGYLDRAQVVALQRSADLLVADRHRAPVRVPRQDARVSGCQAANSGARRS